MAAATMEVREPDVTSPILAMRAEGVRGGVRRRRERVVVWDFRRVVEAWIIARGLGIASSVVVGVEVGVVF